MTALDVLYATLSTALLAATYALNRLSLATAARHTAPIRELFKR